MATVKAKMKYRVMETRNPSTLEMFKRPVITDRTTFYLDQVVKYAIENGYVRGQFHDMRGALNGFIEAIQRLGLDGMAVSLNDWLRVHAELSGVVGDDGQLTDMNELNVRITPLKELKIPKDRFSWTNVDDQSAKPRVDAVCNDGSGEAGVVARGEPIVLSGRNLAADTAAGDGATATWKEGEETRSVTLAIVQSGYGFANLAWNEQMDGIAGGTELTISISIVGTDGVRRTAGAKAKVKAS